MKKFFSSMKAKVFGAVGFAAAASTSAMAVVPAPTPVAVDLSVASQSLTNAGNAMIGLSIVILGFAIVLGFIGRRK